MKVLMITPAFPPAGGSHMQRMLNFANSLAAEKNVELHVLACELLPSYPYADFQSMNLIDSRICVYYAPEGYLHRKGKVKSNNKENYTPSNNKGKIKSALVKLGNKYKQSLLIPDTRIDWYFSAMKYVRENNLIENINPDLILSCSMPNTVHLIGYNLSKRYNKKLFMDYGDPWAYEISIKRGKLRFLIERLIERTILKKAIHVSFATDTTRNLYVDKYELDSRKTTVAMMGFNEAEIKKGFNNGNVSYYKECLTMTYGGALNPAHRNPLPLFEAVNSLSASKKHIQIKLRVDDISRIKQHVNSMGLEGNIEVESYIPFDQYIEEANSYDVLILFGNSTSMQISGKLFNYMGTGMRILYIKNMDKGAYDPTEEILKKYGNTTIVQNNADDISRVLSTLQNEKLKGGILRTSSDNILEYTWKNQGAKFAKAVLNTL
jgi:hypothetical protein